MREFAGKNKRATSADNLRSTQPPGRQTARETQGPRATSGPTGLGPEGGLRRTQGLMTPGGITEIRSVRPPQTQSQSRALVPVSPRRVEEPTRVGQLLDDITLLICLLGVVATVACTAAALMGWI